MSLLLNALDSARALQPDQHSGGASDADGAADGPALVLEPIAQQASSPLEIASSRDAPDAAALTPVRAPARTEVRTGPGSTIGHTRMQAVPAVMLGAAAIALAYGLYLYVQIYHPGWLQAGFWRSEPTPAAHLAAPVVPDGLHARSAEPIAAQASPSSEPTTQASAATVPAIPELAAGLPSVLPQPAAKPDHAPARPAATATKRERPLRADRKPVQHAPALPKSNDSDAASTADAAPVFQEAPAIRRSDTAADVSALNAWRALQSGRHADALRLYRLALETDPKDVHVLLGLAAAHVALAMPDAAQDLYRQVLELEPGNVAARANLIALQTEAGDESSGDEISDLIARQPSDFLYALLGQIHARQQRWPQAQEAFFEALQLQPSDAGHAYNLAVALEHLGQPTLARDYYRRALESGESRVDLDRARIMQRIAHLDHDR